MEHKDKLAFYIKFLSTEIVQVFENLFGERQWPLDPT